MEKQDDGMTKIAGWKAAYKGSSTGGMDAALMEKFWSFYDSESTSIWTMVYDEVDSNEDLEQTIEIVTSFMKSTTAISDQCFGIVHTLESFEIEGIWFFNGPDPEAMFGANEDSSWFTFSQLGPEATDAVKQGVAKMMLPEGQTLNGKTIKDTQVFC